MFVIGQACQFLVFYMLFIWDIFYIKNVQLYLVFDAASYVFVLANEMGAVTGTNVVGKIKNLPCQTRKKNHANRIRKSNSY